MLENSYLTRGVRRVGGLADTVVVMDAGRATAVGPVAQVLAGDKGFALAGHDAAALLQGTVTALDTQWHLAQVAFAGGSVWLRADALRAGQQVRVRVLARDVSVSRERPRASSVLNIVPVRLLALTTPKPLTAVAAVVAAAAAVPKKNILILGGTRFIGVYLARDLIKAGHEVTLLTRGKAPITQQIADLQTQLATLQDQEEKLTVAAQQLLKSSLNST